MKYTSVWFHKTLHKNRLEYINSSTPDKMAAILADDNFKFQLLNENDRILIQISLNP